MEIGQIIMILVIVLFLGLFWFMSYSIRIKDEAMEKRQQAHERYMAEKRLRILDADAARAHECRMAAEQFKEAVKMMRELEAESPKRYKEFIQKLEEVKP